MNFPAYAPDPETTTRYLFFTGKGGVGKTSLACAVALRLADIGRRVLLVSTDPASNLDEVLEVKLAGSPTPVPGCLGLYALNIEPEEAAHAYRERIIGPMRGILPNAALQSIEEQLSGSCTVEIAAFDEFTGLIGNPETTRAYDHIVFDTAPTGHTLRLMSLAKAWDQFLDANTSGTSCLGPLAGLEKQKGIYEATVRTLADPTRTTLVLVSRPQASALREAERTFVELRQLGVANQKLVINGVFQATNPGDELAAAMQRRGVAALRGASSFLQTLPVAQIRLRPVNILGLAGARALLSGDAQDTFEEVDGEIWEAPEMRDLSSLIDEIAADGNGVVMTMGKGGVGKTTVAAAIAVALVRRGHSVHLSTTDPAAHVAEALAGGLPGLTIGKIDPTSETEAYRRHVLSTTGMQMDGAGRALLEEDLRSPCTEEIAIFRAFAREVGQGTEGFVVLDTAPTGHTLLLLDSSEAYHRELNRQARSTQPQEVLRLLDRLRDPEFTRILLVTLPEATPVHEAAALQEDLRRAQIEPFAWVINQSLFNSGSADPVLQRREREEHRYIDEVCAQPNARVVWMPWQAQEPVGVESLTQLTTTFAVLHR